MDYLHKILSNKIVKAKCNILLSVALVLIKKWGFQTNYKGFEFFLADSFTSCSTLLARIHSYHALAIFFGCIYR